MLGQHGQQVAELLPALVQRHLDQRGLRAVHRVQHREQAVEVLGAFGERLAGAGVGAGDVDLHHGAASGRPFQRDAVVLDAFVDVPGQVVIGAGDGDGDLQGPGLGPGLLGAGDHLVAAVVGQTHVHHHRIVFGQAVEPRLRVAGAGAGGGRADGFEPEAGVVHQHRHIAVLVQAGGQAERVGEVHAHHRSFEHRVGVVQHLAQQPHQWRDVAGDAAELDHLVVRHVRGVVEHEVRFDDVLVSEREQVGGGFVDGVVPEALGNVGHASIVSLAVGMRRGVPESRVGRWFVRQSEECSILVDFSMFMITSACRDVILRSKVVVLGEDVR